MIGEDRIERMGTTRFAQNELARLSYEVSGADSAPTVMLLHATLLDRTSLRPLQEKLGDRARVIQLDARGHGASSALAGRSFSVSDMATDLFAVLEAEGIASAPLTIVGHGQGAIAGLEFARIRPDLVRKLVMIEPDALSLLDGDLDAEVIQSREAARATMRAAADAVYKGLTERALEMYLGRRWGADWKDKLSKPRLASIKRNSLALTASLDAFDRYRILPEELKALEVPTMIVAAESTPPAEQRIALRLREQLPKSEMITTAELPPASPLTGSGASLTDFIASWIV
jgi:pimeloyl-ACP methyl ester carboxylesterase